MGDNGRRDSNNTTAELLLLPTLLDLLDRFERLQPYLPHSNVCVLNIARILYSCSRAPELRSVLGRSFALRAVLARTPVQTSTSPLVLPVNQTATSVVDNSPECRLWKLHTLAYLVTNNVENRVLFYEQDGLLDTVLRVGHFDPAIATRQHAAAVLLAFSSSSPHGTSSTTPTAATCSTIPVSMSHNNKVLGTLVKMVLLEKDSTVIRETAVSTLQNLAFWHENRHALVVFRNGMVLEAMKHSLLSDPCEKVRRRVAGALANLVCEETVARIAHYKGLLEALAMVATNDINSAVQERASLALTKIASSMSVKMECHTAVMDALVVASLSSAKNGVSALLRVKARLSKNRQVMARHAGVMDTLTDFCMSESVPSSDRDNAIRTLMHLANDDSNRSILCHNANVLAAMVAVAGRENSSHQQEIPEADAATNDRFDSDDEARDSAIRALERLATYNSNRVIMARHPGLIVAVAKAVEREAQWEQESRRARSEDNGVREADTRGKGEYLAKPLLLSLLVAM